MEYLKKLDAFPKTLDEVRVKTVPGAILSIVSLTLMLILFLSEFSYFLHTERVDHLYVNTTKVDKIRVTFDVSFHEIPCNLISIDAFDDLGIPQKDIYHEVYKHKITANENLENIKGSKGQFSSFFGLGSNTNNDIEIEKSKQMLGDTIVSEEDLKNLFPSDKDKNRDPNCGNCYGAGSSENSCCQTCDDVRNAYATKGWKFNPQGIVQCRKESELDNLKSEKAIDGGCKIYGLMDLNKAAGHFHIAPHRNAHKDKAVSNSVLTLLDFISFTFDQFNITHTVNYLAFGDQYPGINTPLVNQKRNISDTHGMYQYYLKIVPTKYKAYNSKKEVESNQYSVTEHMRHLSPGSGRGVPGVYFNYEMAPIQASIEERRSMTLGGFFTSVCAIIGGVFTVLGILDSFILSAINTFFGRNLLVS